MKLIERAIAGILLTIAAGMAVHTPLTLWLGTILPAWSLVIKSWKELLMGVCLVLLVVAAVRCKKLNELLSDRLLQLGLVYAGLHFVMMMVFQNGLVSAGAGLLIDLRYVLYFVLVYAFLRLYPEWRKRFVVAFGAGAVIILGFALLQVTVLPKDILAHIGYSKATISPYLTVDENPAFIRINSTLRGPNPLGAYSVMVLGIMAAYVVRRTAMAKQYAWIIVAVAVAACMALAASYSRSSLIAAVVTLVTVTLLAVTPTLRKRLTVGFAVLLVVAAAAIFLLRDSYVVSNIILHDNPATGANVDSNEGHAESLIDGMGRLLRQPLGAGVGSTGSASLIGDDPVIIENQYLLIAHEVGWAGLALFTWLFVEILKRLWRQRQTVLGLGVFGGGVGLACIGLLLPVWTDDTVSIVWWGLAAVAIAVPAANIKRTSKKG